MNYTRFIILFYAISSNYLMPADHVSNQTDTMQLSILARSDQEFIFNQSICVSNCEERFRKLNNICNQLQDDKKLAHLYIDSVFEDKKRRAVWIVMKVSETSMLEILKTSLEAYDLTVEKDEDHSK